VKAWIEYSHGRDAAAWTVQHARGEVPDALPYGLDRLAESGIIPVVRARMAPGPLRTVAAVARRGGYQWVEAVAEAPPEGTDVCICWDERSGAPRAARDGTRLPVASGAIWITDHPRHPLHRAAARALARCRLVWVHARPQLDLLSDLGVPRRSLEFLHFGVDADFFRRPDAAQRQPGLVLSAGNDRDRDWPTLLEAFSRVRRRLPEARLEIATLAALPAVPGITVHRSLSHTQLREAYARAWCVAVPTRMNRHLSGLTNTLEAQAMGVPVVMSATPGTRDYVHEADNGLLFPPGDADALARALEAVLTTDLEGVRQMGAVARAGVDERTSSAQHAATLAALLRSHC
jgi:glycosyltransferase involved in cell wall biosynthesis